jgi:hypothetical protein
MEKRFFSNRIRWLYFPDPEDYRWSVYYFADTLVFEFGKYSLAFDIKGK